MGCYSSSPQRYEDSPQLDTLCEGYDIFSFRQFQAKGDRKSKLEKLRSYSMDYISLPISDIPDQISKALLICVNDYPNNEHSWNNGSINDAIYAANSLRKYDFQIYSFLSPPAAQFLGYFRTFLQRTTEYLTILFIGPISDTPVSNNSDLSSNSLCFKDNLINCSTFTDYLMKFKKNSLKALFLFDSIHINTDTPLYDFFSGENCRLIYLTGQKLEPGLLSFNFWRYFVDHPSMTPNDLKNFMKEELARFQIDISIKGFSPEEEELSIFPECTPLESSTSHSSVEPEVLQLKPLTYN